MADITCIASCRDGDAGIQMKSVWCRWQGSRAAVFVYRSERRDFGAERIQSRRSAEMRIVPSAGVERGGRGDDRRCRLHVQLW